MELLYARHRGQEQRIDANPGERLTYPLEKVRQPVRPVFFTTEPQRTKPVPRLAQRVRAKRGNKSLLRPSQQRRERGMAGRHEARVSVVQTTRGRPPLVNRLGRLAHVWRCAPLGVALHEAGCVEPAARAKPHA